MKVALVTGGQPRFTYDFILLMNQLSGFDSADIYMVLWKSSWAQTEAEAREKIKKILQPGYKLKRIKVIDEPTFNFPSHDVFIPPPEPENIAWWFKRGKSQFYSLALAGDLIDENYDLVIRFRLDGRLDRAINIRSLDCRNNFILPKNSQSGFDDFKINDQFAIGTQESMMFYLNFGKEYEKLIPIADPLWVNNGVDRRSDWTWSTEHLLGTYMKIHNRPRVLGDFDHLINTQGRSKFTDKHYHHRIVPDPTE
jgi:hypothetical protein